MKESLSGNLTVTNTGWRYLTTDGRVYSIEQTVEPQTIAAGAAGNFSLIPQLQLFNAKPSGFTIGMIPLVVTKPVIPISFSQTLVRQTAAPAFTIEYQFQTNFLTPFWLGPTFTSPLPRYSAKLAPYINVVSNTLQSPVALPANSGLISWCGNTFISNLDAVKFHSTDFFTFDPANGSGNIFFPRWSHSSYLTPLLSSTTNNDLILSDRIGFQINNLLTKFIVSRVTYLQLQ